VTRRSGNCGLPASEQNCLIKAAQLPGKVMFVSASPCVMCAKMIINTNVARGLLQGGVPRSGGPRHLRQGGVEVIHYDRWRDCGASRASQFQRDVENEAPAPTKFVRALIRGPEYKGGGYDRASRGQDRSHLWRGGG